MLTIDEVLSRNDPAIELNDDGMVASINESFTTAYGWNRADLVNQPVTLIIPTHMQNAHHLGFSRFLLTETPTLLGKPLPLPIVCKNGQVLDAEHFIIAEKKDGRWRFAALIKIRKP